MQQGLPSGSSAGAAGEPVIRRSTWVLVLIFAALVGLAWYLQRNPQQGQGEVTPTAELGTLLQVDSAGIQSVEVRSAAGQRVVLERSGDEWALVEPREGPADSGRMSWALGRIAALHLVAALENPPPAGETGLDPAAYTLTVTLSGGGQQSARIGELTPIQNGYYAAGQDGKVYVASALAVEEILDLLHNPPYRSTPTVETPVVTQTPEQ